MPGGAVFLPAKAWSHWLFEVVCGTCEEATTQWWSSSVMRPRSKARSCRALSRGLFDDMRRLIGVNTVHGLMWLAVNRAGMSMPVRQQAPS